MNLIKKYEHKAMSELLRMLGLTIKWGIHQNGYWLTNFHYNFDYMLSNLLLQYLKKKDAKSVIDIGCGRGDYINELNFHNIQAVGIDGNSRLITSLDNDKIFCFDVTNDYLVSDVIRTITKSNEKAIQKKGEPSIRNLFSFDYVLCLNVGEYIPKMKEERFIKNLDQLNKKGIILAWDKPNSFNIGTLNEKSEEEIIQIFSNNLNYLYDEKTSKYFRDYCNHKNFRNSLYIFEKKKL